MKDKHKQACMKCAEAWAECSSATRLKVGSVAYKNGHIIAEGYNGLPKGIEGSCEDEEGNTRIEVTHSEDNLLRKLTRSTESSEGCTIFVTHAPCKNCSIKIVDSGCIAVYYRYTYRDLSGIEYLKSNGVEVFQI